MPGLVVAGIAAPAAEPGLQMHRSMLVGASDDPAETRGRTHRQGGGGGAAARRRAANHRRCRRPPHPRAALSDAARVQRGWHGRTHAPASGGGRTAPGRRPASFGGLRHTRPRGDGGGRRHVDRSTSARLSALRGGWLAACPADPPQHGGGLRRRPVRRPAAHRPSRHRTVRPPGRGGLHRRDGHRLSRRAAGRHRRGRPAAARARTHPRRAERRRQPPVAERCAGRACLSHQSRAPDGGAGSPHGAPRPAEFGRQGVRPVRRRLPDRAQPGTGGRDPGEAPGPGQLDAGQGNEWVGLPPLRAGAGRGLGDEGNGGRRPARPVVAAADRLAAVGERQAQRQRHQLAHDSGTTQPQVETSR